MEAITLVIGFSTCDAKSMVALVLRYALVLKCNFIGVLITNNEDPGC